MKIEINKLIKSFKGDIKQYEKKLELFEGMSYGKNGPLTTLLLKEKIIQFEGIKNYIQTVIDYYESKESKGVKK